MTATHELVVPRSMPMTLAMSSILSFAADRPRPNRFGARLPEAPKRPCRNGPLELRLVVLALYSGGRLGLQRARPSLSAGNRIEDC